MKNRDECPELNIEQLIGLYQDDPERFEDLRRRLIDCTIEGFPSEHRQRAYGLQFQIEARLSHHKDPVARMSTISEMFWEHLETFQQVLNNPGAVLEERKKRQPAKVIPLRLPLVRH